MPVETGAVSRYFDKRMINYISSPLLVFFLLLSTLACQTRGTNEQTGSQQVAESKNLQEFKAFIKDLRSEFIYLDEKKVIVDCIEKTYSPYVDTISHPFYKVLFYEQLLNELYDSHVHLNSNTDRSCRLNAPVYVEWRNDRFYIKNVFSSQLDYQFDRNIIGAEVLSFNGTIFQKAVDEFATHCHDKNDPEVREWLGNKVLAGKYHEPRVVELKLPDGKELTLDIDRLIQRQESSLLTASVSNNIGTIRINNSLGNDGLVEAFDSVLNTMMDTRALILDLRNTPDGGITGVAEPMMGRFISEERGYQLCESKTESYTSTVVPVGKTYPQPVFVLAGRWTGSMGEGMTIGLEGMQRATVIGTEMARLAGGMKTVPLINSNFGFRISFEKMRHIDGSLREEYVPDHYVDQKSLLKDEWVAEAVRLIGDN